MGGTVAEVEVPVEEFALYETAAELGEVGFEVERVVAHDPDHVIPFVWVSGKSTDDVAIEAALDADESVESFESLATFEDEWLYRMDWGTHVQTLIRVLVEEEGTVMAASGQGGTWNLRVLFPEREGLSRTREFCADAGLTWDIRRIYRLDEGRQGRYGLTDKQQDTLTEAFERGYYNVPRGAAAKELADGLNVSHQALSEQLRRAHGNLVKNAIVVGRGADSEED
jgi:predicted DNA binding protein